MKRILLLIAILSAAITASTFAALGNSESEIQELFGKPVDQGFPDAKGVTTNVYQKGNYTILVQFLRHLSLAESYTRTDRKDFTQKEIDAFLEGSGNERTWIKDPNKQAWERDDHRARAWCENLSGRPTLLIQAH